MNEDKDYYAILGVLPTAEDVVIRAAYKALAQRYHPDRFSGSLEEAHRFMAELNEAYSILSSIQAKQKYDRLRGTNTQSGDSYFGGDTEDEPPKNDPLEKDWATVTKYYRDLILIESRLSKISWRLAYSFRVVLLETKTFEVREQVAKQLEQQFLEIYFGTNPKIIAFARQLIDTRQKPAAHALNETIRILGSKIDAARIIAQIMLEFNLDRVDARTKAEPDEIDSFASFLKSRPLDEQIRPRLQALVDRGYDPETIIDLIREKIGNEYTYLLEYATRRYSV